MLLDAVLVDMSQQGGPRVEQRPNPIAAAAQGRPIMEFDTAISVVGPLDESEHTRRFEVTLGDGRIFRCIHRGHRPIHPVPRRAVLVRGVPLQLNDKNPDENVTFRPEDVEEVR